MIREICRDTFFLARKAAPATADDLAAAQDLLDTLIAHRDGCVGMAANMIGICKSTIDQQGQTRLTACLSGAFCPFRLGGRQPACVSKAKNHSKIHCWQVRAVLSEQKCAQTRKDPQRILAVLSRGLT